MPWQKGWGFIIRDSTYCSCKCVTECPIEGVFLPLTHYPNMLHIALHLNLTVVINVELKQNKSLSNILMIHNILSSCLMDM